MKCTSLIPAFLLRLTRFERATYGFEVRCSIQMSYRRILANCHQKKRCKKFISCTQGA